MASHRLVAPLLALLMLGACRRPTSKPHETAPPSGAPRAAEKANLPCDSPKLQDACERHELESCGQLGYCFAHGEGRTRDDRKAVELYTIACDGQVVAACGNLGFMYATGRGTARDEKLAFTLYEKACKGGSVGDCTNTASALHLGQGTAKDLERAREMYTQSCKSGDGAGCTGLGILNSEASPPDDRQAAANFRAGCDHGDELGCGNLGLMLAKGRGVDADPVAARPLYERACRAERWEHCTNLGIALANGEGGPRDPDKAMRVLEPACTAEHATACYTLAYINGQRGNHDEAHRLFTVGCKLGDEESCAFLEKLGSRPQK